MTFQGEDATFSVLILHAPFDFDTENQSRAIAQLEAANKGFIPGINIKSVHWLIPEWTETNRHGSLVLEFARPEDANAAIREQFVRQAEADRRRLARANWPKYHDVGAEVPCLDDLRKTDIPSRMHYPAYRYSMDFLRELEARRGSKSPARGRGCGRRAEALRLLFDENQGRVLGKRHLHADNSFHSILEPNAIKRRAWRTNERAAFQPERYNNKEQFRSRLEDLGIEPYLIGENGVRVIEPFEGDGSLTPETSSKQRWESPRSIKKIKSAKIFKASSIKKKENDARSPLKNSAAVAKILAIDKWR
ncbi:uncharacterized protein KY384_004144 [Bacidia gigantensis]|uniref:uncharacterized protein n=1 Tax=Bacidia gigantensis TaxID=2732470 RepID=UPI001D04E60B|nr:uncharacterized protein KY384_004144 [Bacidia gigantensis]KAG8530787.1 hypothetical protein KY384_004144 [Bacidia gigantensis]